MTFHKSSQNLRQEQHSQHTDLVAIRLARGKKYIKTIDLSGIVPESNSSDYEKFNAPLLLDVKLNTNEHTKIKVETDFTARKFYFKFLLNLGIFFLKANRLDLSQLFMTIVTERNRLWLLISRSR